MPYRIKVGIDTVEEFSNFGKLSIPLEEVKRRMAAGEELIFESSNFNDLNGDYTALFLGKERIGFWLRY